MILHPDFDTLLRSILAAPDDALGWLMAADWCGDHGYPEDEAVLRAKRIPIDELTFEACSVLAPLPTFGNFIRDVCGHIRVFGTGDPATDDPQGKPFCLPVASANDRLSPKQYLWVWKLVLKYRHWIDRPHLIERAKDLLAVRAP